MSTQYTNTIYLIRHGENLANVTGEFSYKRVDYSLTAKGVLQAQQTAAHLHEWHIDEFFSSPLKRARETAEIIAEPHHLPVTLFEEFRELNVGDLEDAAPTAENWDYHNNILAQWYHGHLDVSFPNGESFLTLTERGKQGLHKVTWGKQGRVIAIAGHPVTPLMRNCPSAFWHPSERHSLAVSTSSSRPTSCSNTLSSVASIYCVTA